MTARPADPVRPDTTHARWPWAITTATIATIVCTLGWPRPTLNALGITLGATAMLIGLRLLAVERRATEQPVRPALATRAAARTYLQQRGLTEAEAVWLLCFVIGQTYREIADDAEDGAEGNTWGTSAPEALRQFAAAYRAFADEIDPRATEEVR